jgi:hypothetical protein
MAADWNYPISYSQAPATTEDTLATSVGLGGGLSLVSSGLGRLPSFWSFSNSYNTLVTLLAVLDA